MAGELGKASLDLEANLGPFERNLASAHAGADRLDHALEALAAVADVCQKALNDVKLDAAHGAESRVTAEAILSGVRHISDASMEAAREIDKVKLGSEQAAETEAAGAVIDHELDNIHDKAERTQRMLDRVRLRLAGAAFDRGGGNRPGYGIGIFGAGYGRAGLVGTGVGLGVASLGVLGPAGLGVLAAMPALALTGAGALGTLALAFKGVGKAIGGDEKAFKDLSKPAQQFVLTVRSLDGLFDRLRKTAAVSLFPGLTQGLKSALSPGTVNAVFTAVTELGRALGSVAAEFGKYFGSGEFQKIFGPLMQSAARNIRVMGDAALHLFDALGVLMRAAIPLTNWLVSAADKGAKLLDTWLHAKDASGQLSHAMDQARQSLALLGGLIEALVKAAAALAAVLWPIGKVLVGALTRGLNGLAGTLKRNEGVLRGIIGGALKLFIAAVKAAADGVAVLYHALESILTKKGVIIAGIAAIGVALALALGPYGAVIAGVLIAIGLIKDHWRTVVVFFKTLGKEILLGFEYLWFHIEKLALEAALKVVEPFSHLPSFLGGWARKAKDSMQHQLDKIRPPDMNWHDVAAAQGAATGDAWAGGFNAAVSARAKATDSYYGIHDAPKKKKKDPHPGTDPKPGTHAWYMKMLGYDPTLGPTFGKPPPFTTNTGSGSGSKSAIPTSVSQLDALAARQDQQAAALKYAGAKAREHLLKEISDLEQADKILEEKIKRAHGKTRVALENALTANLKKIAEARKRVHDAATLGRQAALNYALDAAKLAVEKAKQGSRAWDLAISAEEKALRAEIRYWDKVAHDTKLSKDARDKALKKELAYEHELNGLLKQTGQAAVANEKQFLTTFADIQNSFAPNALPVPTGKTDTHLYDIKQEARQTNRHLAAIRRRRRHHATDAHHDAAMAV